MCLKVLFTKFSTILRWFRKVTHINSDCVDYRTSQILINDLQIAPLHEACSLKLNRQAIMNRVGHLRDDPHEIYRQHLMDHQTLPPNCQLGVILDLEPSFLMARYVSQITIWFKAECKRIQASYPHPTPKVDLQNFAIPFMLSAVSNKMIQCQRNPNLT